MVTPSVVVNPPAIQYFKGVDHDWVGGGFKDTDNRFLQMKENVILVLSSKEYPNPPICSKALAGRIADRLIPGMLKKIKDKDVTITKVYRR
jgi:hypothetical protein